ncbi:hypothetical protein [Xanthomonas sp. BRIP62418]|uniref:hypothetical protein n=1 Tax=Xanthomonas sp. BRIP62418 TaxID=2182391 RepID=UPI0013DFAA43|nr:hypothetical protein [Xanthomonas sp. BRIP62418]
MLRTDSSGDGAPLRTMPDNWQVMLGCAGTRASRRFARTVQLTRASHDGLASSSGVRCWQWTAGRARSAATAGSAIALSADPWGAAMAPTKAMPASGRRIEHVADPLKRDQHSGDDWLHAAACRTGGWDQRQFRQPMG